MICERLLAESLRVRKTSEKRDPVELEEVPEKRNSGGTR